jgi:hypothetical protein
MLWLLQQEVSITSSNDYYNIHTYCIDVSPMWKLKHAHYSLSAPNKESSESAISVPTNLGAGFLDKTD